MLSSSKKLQRLAPTLHPQNLFSFRIEKQIRFLWTTRVVYNHQGARVSDRLVYKPSRNFHDIKNNYRNQISDVAHISLFKNWSLALSSFLLPSLLFTASSQYSFFSRKISSCFLEFDFSGRFSHLIYTLFRYFPIEVSFSFPLLSLRSYCLWD